MPITQGICQVCRTKDHLHWRLESILPEGRRIKATLPPDGVGFPVARKMQQLEQDETIRRAKETMPVSDDEEELVPLAPLQQTRSRRDISGWTFLGRMDGQNTSFLQIDVVADSVPRLHFFLQGADGTKERTPMLQAHGLAFRQEQESRTLFLRPHWTHWGAEKKEEDNGVRVAALHLSDDL